MEEGVLRRLSSALGSFATALTVIYTRDFRIYVQNLKYCCCELATGTLQTDPTILEMKCARNLDGVAERYSR
jgi:hypothetical protein